MSLTLAAAYERFLKERQIKACTARQYRYGYKYLKSIAEVPLSKLEPNLVVHWFDGLVASVGFSLAHRTYREAKAVASHVLKNKPNPFDVLRQLNRLKPSDPEDEIIHGTMWQRWFVGVLELPFDSGRDLVLFLWQTGCRVKEARLLTWKDVDLEVGTYSVPDVVTGLPVVLPLPTFAIKILAARRPKDVDKDEHVFTGLKEGTPTCWTARGYKEMCSRNVLPRTLSTIRKSVTAVMIEDMKLPEPTIKALLNRSTANPAFYQTNPEELRAPVERLSARLLELAKFTLVASPPMVVKTSNVQPTFNKVFPMDLSTPSVSLSVTIIQAQEHDKR